MIFKRFSEYDSGMFKSTKHRPPFESKRYEVYMMKKIALKRKVFEIK